MTATGYVVGAAATVLVAVFGYLGVRYQARTARAGSDATVQSDTVRLQLEGWQALFEANSKAIKDLEERQDRRDEEHKRTREELADLRRSHDALTQELHRWQRVARTLARWGVTMRDQLRGLGQEVPAEPDELVALQIVSERDDDLRP